MINFARLPYKKDALEPFLSESNMEHHYEKHYKGYVTKLNNILKDNEQYKKLSLRRIVQESYHILTTRGEEWDTFKVAAQAWNHQFLWKSMTPRETKPSYRLTKQLEKAFGSIRKFKDLFEEAGTSVFGTGWVWLVYDLETNSLKVTPTIGAHTPITTDHQIPLLVCDVWEHAYYPTYYSDRAAYLKAFWNVVDWEFVSVNYEVAFNKRVKI
jgi:Fe-Mn family superoxide dismutase